MRSIGRTARRGMLGGVGAGSAIVVLLLVAAPLTAANYVNAGWTTIASSGAAGPTVGSGVNTPMAGQPTALLTAGVVKVTFGFGSTSGPGFGFANYHQQATAWATPVFAAWKAGGSGYNTSVLFRYQLAANDVVASVNCGGGGSANATAVIVVQIAIYDLTTGTYAANLGPLGGAPIWAPFNASCAGAGTASVGNPAFFLAGGPGNLTGPIGIVLTPGNFYQIEGLIAAYGSAYTTVAGATASATVNFGLHDYVEIVGATAY